MFESPNVRKRSRSHRGIDLEYTESAHSVIERLLKFLRLSLLYSYYTKPFKKKCLIVS